MDDSQKRIAVAFLLGAVVIAGALLMRKSDSVETTSGTIVVAPVERLYVDVVDSNQDGVPDWRDALEDSNPILLPKATSTYSAPDTVTGKFAVNFFENYVRSKSYGAFGESNEELTTLYANSLAKQALDELYVETDITIFPSSGTQDLQTYGTNVASIILAHPYQGDSEIVILQEVSRTNNMERLSELEPIVASYVATVKDLLEVAVPNTYTKEHLDLLNAVNAVKIDIEAMQKLETDPMYTLLRMKRYEDDVLGMSNALKNLFSRLYLQDTVRWESSDPVLKLITFTP
jgi:hypothetical protein